MKKETSKQRKRRSLDDEKNIIKIKWKQQIENKLWWQFILHFSSGELISLYCLEFWVPLNICCGKRLVRRGTFLQKLLNQTIGSKQKKKNTFQLSTSIWLWWISSRMISLNFIYLSCRVQFLFYHQHMQRMLISRRTQKIEQQTYKYGQNINDNQRECYRSKTHCSSLFLLLKLDFKRTT